jgi:DNA-binding transcriptional ArsR family regulator
VENPVDNRLEELERRIAALESTAAPRLRPQADDGLEELAERDDWSGWASVLAALGNPVRLLLLQQIVKGVNTVSALSEVEALGTSGQIYHHLRQLTAEGWLHSPSRGIFALPPSRAAALLEILVALER